MRLQQHRSIDVGDATLECTLCGSGAPVVLLANAGCSTGYFDHLARALVTGGFQTISINMRGVGRSSGSLDGATLHDLAGDVAGVIKAIGCGTVHLVGHAFGNRIARCLAVDQPPLVRSVRGSMMKRRRRGMGMRCASSWASGCGSSIYLMPGTFCCWNSRKL